MADIQRQTAYKCKVKQILEAKYIQQQGWEPNYLEISNIRAGRINLMAAIVSKENNTITVDDGTGQVNLILFQNQEMANNLDVADIITIIGRPREYQGQRYIVPEILKILEDKKWIEYRKKELELQEIDINKSEEKEPEEKLKNDKKVIKNNKSMPQEYVLDEVETKNPELQSAKIEPLFKSATEKKPDNTSQKIINAIKKFDTGPGANMEDIITEVNHPDAEKYINILINEGEIFEIRAGRIKILD